MTEIPLYPLKFEPIYQYRLWGGRRLAHLLSTPLPSEGPVGEAWILSDREDHCSVVSNGPLQGTTLRQLMEERPKQMIDDLSTFCGRFPLLLKFLDVEKGLSVQVHPSDAHRDLIPAGDTGKTESWVVLETGPQARIYAGLKSIANPENLRKAISTGTVEKELASFVPMPGDAVYIQAGTVHSLQDVVVFEVQENSDVTFRLFDWNHVDPKTGRGRPLQVEQAMESINFKQGEIGPTKPVKDEQQKTELVLQEKLIQCDHFGVTRFSADAVFIVGKNDTPRVLVCLSGLGSLIHDNASYPVSKGEVFLLPAVVGACACHTSGYMVLLEISLPEIYQ